MSKDRMLQGPRKPNMCYHCGKRLQAAKGKDLVYFNLIRVPGVDKELRVHGFPCTQLAIEDGATFVAGSKP